MQYTISDIRRMLQSYSRKTVAAKLGISTIKLNEVTNNVTELSGVRQILKNPPFNLIQEGQVILGSDDEDAPTIELEVLKNMLINTEKAKVAENLCIGTPSLTKLMKSMPEHFENLPKAVKLPFTLVDDAGNAIAITSRPNIETEDDEVSAPVFDAPSIVEDVNEITSATEEIVNDMEIGLEEENGQGQPSFY